MHLNCVPDKLTDYERYKFSTSFILGMTTHALFTGPEFASAFICVSYLPTNYLLSNLHICHPYHIHMHKEFSRFLPWC